MIYPDIHYGYIIQLFDMTCRPWREGCDDSSHVQAIFNRGGTESVTSLKNDQQKVGDVSHTHEDIHFEMRGYDTYPAW